VGVPEELPPQGFVTVGVPEGNLTWLKVQNKMALRNSGVCAAVKIGKNGGIRLPSGTSGSA